MIPVIAKEILDELREVANKFKNEESMLDPQAMSMDSSLRRERFSTEFPQAMAKFRRLDLVHKGEYASMYETACENFFELVSIGKSNKIIVKRADQQELKRLKELKENLESELHQCKTEKRVKEEELSNLKALIEAVSRTHTFLKPFFNIEVSKAEDKDEQPSGM